MSLEDKESSSPTAGWYDDPLKQEDLRWFDGTAWTDHTRAHPASVATNTPYSPSSLSQISKKTRVIGLFVLILLLGAIAYLGFGIGKGDTPASSPSSTSKPESYESLEPGIAGRVEGKLETASDPQAATETAALIASASLISQVEKALNTCASMNQPRSFKGCTTKRLTEIAASLQEPLNACGKPDGVCVKLIGTDGYEIRATDTITPPRTWIQIMTAGGSVTRTCEPVGCSDTGSWDPEQIN